MRYFGSKESTNRTILELVSSRIPNGVFCDPFGGIGSVSSRFKSAGYTVWSGDILNFAHYFQVAKIQYSASPSFKKLFKNNPFSSINEMELYLNTIEPVEGWFVIEYAKKRKFFTVENAGKIEAIRKIFQKWEKEKLLTDGERKVLLASLINSMDRVANTAGTYYAYLKSWNRKALQVFLFKLLIPLASKRHNCCHHIEANELVKKRHFNILYLDPPYNKRSYPHYYHLPETIAMEKAPEIHGMSGIPVGVTNYSEFNRPSKAACALEKLISNASFDLLVFHYADGGLIEPKRVVKILKQFGKLTERLIEAKGYTTAASNNSIYHHVYLVENV